MINDSARPDLQALVKLLDQIESDLNSESEARYQPYTDGRLREAAGWLRRCLDPHSAAAIAIEAARRAERESCKKVVLALRDAWRKGHGQSAGVAYAEAIAAAIGARSEV